MPHPTHQYLLDIISPSATEWDTAIANLPEPHILQSAHWADLKKANGWQPEYLLWRNEAGAVAAAVVLHRKSIPILGKLTGACLLYAPRGPLLDWTDLALRDQVIIDLENYARNRKAIFLKIDPEVALAWSSDPLIGREDNMAGLALEQTLLSRGWHFSQDQLQFRNTVLLDLAIGQDALLARMKQKTRYNIRLAEKRGVAVRAGLEPDLDLLYRMYAETSLRDGFAIRSRDYYLSVWQSLMKAGIAYPLIAEVDSEPVSAIIVFVYGGRGIYFYGMSTEKHRECMPNHLLQWRAIQMCLNKGCEIYDFWGAPDQFDQGDSMYGVYRFKEGFSGRVLLGLGAYDKPLMPLFYWLYTRLLPRLLDLMRKAGRRRVAQEVNG